MASRIIDYAPKRHAEQRSSVALFSGILILIACALAPSPVPQASHAEIPQTTPLISPIPTSEIAGQSAAEGSDPGPFRQGPSVEPADPVQIIREVFGRDAEMAVAIARAESGLSCAAHSHTNDGGLFQINLDWHLPKFDGRSPYDCRANAEVAKEIYDRQGWNPWTVFRTGVYQQYL